MRLIDIHAHLLNTAVERLIAEHPAKLAEARALDAAQGVLSSVHSATMLRAIGPELTSTDRRIDAMDAAGVDVQVLSPAPNQYYSWAAEPLAERIVRLINEDLAQACAAHPDRFLGLGTVALQHPHLAVEQVENAVLRYGLRGVEIPSTVAGVSIAHTRFRPFWQRCAELGCLVLIHPMGNSLGNRLDEYYLWNVIGQPLESTIAVAQLILGGHLDRYPGLKLCVVHGGGFLPAYWGRLDHAWQVRPETRTTTQPPSSYLRRLAVDTVVFDPVQLRHLIDMVGVERVVVGTDYPYDMGVARPRDLLDRVPGLDAADRAAISHGNAERLLTVGAPVTGR